MKSAIFASLIAAAAAFAPVQQQAATTSLKAFEDELGAQPPLGFFDPLGMLNNVSQERFDQLRYTELKHGRVSMLAVVGFLIEYAGIRLPGDIDFSGTSFADIPAGAAAVAAVPKGGQVQLVAFILVLEFIMRDNSGTGEFIGDFRSGTIDYGWDDFDEEEKMQKRAIELNNGRAAMMGILGLMVHEQLGNLGSILPL
mmetsp:Transcript_58324/g.138799  ORF Transcript_58324/g.138799 Transcript_58324/m.138799 type:complete len:198 (+) Transcript_58324:38-631(+)